MKIICNGYDLSEAVNKVIKAVGAKTVSPILEGIKIETVDGGIKLTATDMELAIEKVIAAEVRAEGAVVVPGRLFAEFVKKIDAAGHEIGTHSATHSYMSRLTPSQISSELSSSSKAVTAVTGKTVELFRPPYGDYNDALIQTAEECGLYTIQWDTDSLDWKDLSANDIAMRVINGVRPGSIILMHNNGQHTAESLPLIISTLKNRGYTFKPIGAMIYRGEYTIDSQGRQHSAQKAAAFYGM